MTDRELIIRRLTRLIKAAHNEMSDFVFIPVGTAKVIIRLLEDQNVVRCKDCKHYRDGNCKRTWSWFKPEEGWYCAYGEVKEK